MSGSESPVWRDGEMTLWLVPPPGAAPVAVPRMVNPRSLWADRVHLRLRGDDGRWSVGIAALYGVWARKDDGQPGARSGNIMLSGPLAVEDGAPDWLVVRTDRLVDRLNAAFKEAEQ
jgi:hypothetical protein